MRLADMPTHGDWVLLGEDPPHEIAFGVIGRFWGGEIVWTQIDAADLEAFAEPGFGKIVCNFSLRPHGGDRTLVTCECRTLAINDTARRCVMRYWRPLARSIGLVMRSQLRVNQRKDHRPRDLSGRTYSAPVWTDWGQERSINRPHSFPASDTARDSARPAPGFRPPTRGLGGRRGTGCR
jgi:hypothetical protein